MKMQMLAINNKGPLPPATIFDAVDTKDGNKIFAFCHKTLL